jgi:thymidylate synthase (FAD)
MTEEGFVPEKRVSVDTADAILGKEYRVLDHGFVRLINYMGGDQAIVDAAKVSYGKRTKKTSGNRELIDYLLRHRHASPFEQVVLLYHVKMPIFVMRQWVRHRTARMNEISGRYSILSDDFYVPAPENINLQSKDNKQGRSDECVTPEIAIEIIKNFKDNQEKAYKNYITLNKKNITKELARVNLPLSIYTEAYWQMDLHNLFHFIELRMEKHAQLEIRKYAEILAGIAKTVAPLACESLENHVLNSQTFSGQELKALGRIFLGENPESVAQEEIKIPGARREFLEEKLGRILNK